jgi:ligand-binding sensor domain-containing protein
MFLIQFYNEKWRTWKPETVECEYSSQPFITAMTLDRDGTLWIGGHSYPCGTFGKFTEGKFEFYNVEEPDIILGVSSIAIDREDNIWIGTTFRGLRKYDREQFTTYTTENSDLPDKSVFDIKMDKEGNLWLACGRYLVKFDEKTFIKYEHPDIQSFIHCIAIEDNGDIWIGTHDDGLFLFSNDKFRPIELNLVSIEESDNPAKNEVFTVFSNTSDLVIDFSLTEAARVSLAVFDMQGKEVCSILKEKDLLSGKHQYSCTHTRFSSGVYLVRYVVDGVVSVKKVMNF